MDIKYQKPAQGIMLQGDYENSKNFKVECECSSEDHSVFMWIEVAEDKDIPEIEVSFYVKTWTPLWGGWRDRLKAVYQILFKGLHRQEHHMILNQQSALNFAETIKQTIKEIQDKK